MRLVSLMRLWLRRWRWDREMALRYRIFANEHCRYPNVAALTSMWNDSKWGRRP